MELCSASSIDNPPEVFGRDTFSIVAFYKLLIQVMFVMNCYKQMYQLVLERWIVLVAPWKHPLPAFPLKRTFGAKHAHGVPPTGGGERLS